MGAVTSLAALSALLGAAVAVLLLRLRRADAARRVSELTLGEVTRGLGAGLWIGTIDKQRLLYVSAGLESIFGIPVAEWYARPTAFLDVTHPEDRVRIRDGFARQQRGDYEVRFRILRPDGALRWIETRTTPILDANGVARRIAGITTDITERTMAEDALRDSEGNFRTLAETMSTAVFIYRGTKIIYVNPAALAMVGFTREEVMASEYWDPVHPDMRAEVKRRGQARQAGLEVPSRFEVKLATRSGEERWLDYSASLIQYDGAPAVLGTGIDITDRKRAESALQAANLVLEDRVEERTRALLEANAELRREIGERRAMEAALRDSESRFRSVFEHSCLGISIVSPELRFLDVNPALCAMLGYRPEELVGRAIADITHPGDVEESIRLTSAAFAGRHEAFQMEKRYLHRDGHHFWGSTHVAVLGTVSGGDGYTIGIVEDITERREAAERLRRSEEQFRELAENIHQVFWMVSLQPAGLLYISPAVEAVHGLTAAEIVAEPTRLFDQVHAEDRAAVESLMTAMRTGRTDLEFRITRADGALRWLHAQAFPVLDAQGEPRRIAGITEDITERRLVAEEVRRYSQELERLVEERTARIRELERQRAQGEKLAATGSMAARIAHEINNPLSGIQNSFLLVKDAITPSHPHFGYVARIEREIARIARIVRQMFEVYRPEPLAGPLAGFREIADDLLLLHEPVAAEHGVRLVMVPAEEAGLAIVPDGPVRQVLHNLVQNAIQASPPGGTVTISAEIIPGALRATVSDQGEGIPDDIATRIYEPFFTTKTGLEYGGLGLGLAVARSLVDSMNGTLVFSSSPGEGTTFEVTFPMRAGADAGGSGAVANQEPADASRAG